MSRDTKSKYLLFSKWWFSVILVFVLVGCSGNIDDFNNSLEEMTSSITGEINSSKEEIEVPKQNTSPDVPVSDKASDNEATSDDFVIEETTSDASPITEEITSSISIGQKNALRSADDYLNFTPFSHDGLISQLEFEGYTPDECLYAADNCGADWNQQAALSAKAYLSFSAFSYLGLIKQLEFEKFTSEQATYGADNSGADWNEQAALSAKTKIDMMSFSKQGLIDQLVFEGFTQAQAEYGVAQVGY